MQNNLELVQKRLHSFIKKYHFKQLLKGSLLFLTIGLFYLILVVLLENFLWFDQHVRKLIFWFTVALEIVFLVWLVLMPLLQLSRLRNGLSEKDAAGIIGSHFKEIDDKLVNLIQLSDDKEMTELVKASIAQRSRELLPIPFTKAITFKDNLKYVYYALIPLGIILFSSVTGHFNWFTDGYKRVVNYNIAYEPPSPFNFRILNDSLVAIAGKEFLLTVSTFGEIIPDKVYVEVNGDKYLMQSKGNGLWQYSINDVSSYQDGFRITSDVVQSAVYSLKVLKAPQLISLDLYLDFPAYTKRESERVTNNGNAEILEGTKVKWKASTKEAEEVLIKDKDTRVSLARNENVFTLDRTVYNNFNYELVTGNSQLSNYEVLSYSLKVIKDQYPVLNINILRDTVTNENTYLNVRYSDDYGIDSLDLLYYDVNNPDVIYKDKLQHNRGTFGELIVEFPGTRTLKSGTNYQFFIELTDNDQINGGKKTKSDLFSMYIMTEENKVDKGLQQQQQILSKLGKATEEMNKGIEEINAMTKEQKQKNAISYNDKKEVRQMLNRQNAQQEQMRKFSSRLKENIDKISKKDNKMEELLKEKIERQQKQLEENERLMKELEKLSEKISKEELTRKLEQIARQQQNGKRSLEQILELTKRYYVTAKAEKLQKDIRNLSVKQDSLAKENNAKNELPEQNILTEKFEQQKKILDELEKENEKLQKPMDLGIDKKLEQQIQKDQKEAEEELNKELQEPSQESKDTVAPSSDKDSKSNKSQKKSAVKMKQLSEKMQKSMEMESGESIQEDAEMLRQVLDNLVLFSFDQEALINRMNLESDLGSSFARRLKEQNELKDLFKHVDDSLFALSLRRPEISDVINKEITDVYFNVDQALVRLAENRIYQGIASQQYVLTAANNLADFLSNVLDNMQESIGSGKGKSAGDFQLPDIIQSQKDLNKQMGEGGKKPSNKKEKGKEGKGEEGTGSDSKSGSGENMQGGKSGSKTGDGYSEKISEELFEMYKQQQQIREALERQLDDKEGKGSQATKRLAIRQMEMIEQELLERGVTERVQQLMKGLEYQMMKLEKAVQEQGFKPQRESETGEKEYINPVDRINPDIKQYFEQLEILNRQVLPLRQIYKGKVNEYFNGGNKVSI
jgi:hypothetical protein